MPTTEEQILRTTGHGLTTHTSNSACWHFPERLVGKVDTGDPSLSRAGKVNSSRGLGTFCMITAFLSPFLEASGNTERFYVQIQE